MYNHGVTFYTKSYFKGVSMYCITASNNLEFTYFVEVGDTLIIDETMPLLNGD